MCYLKLSTQNKAMILKSLVNSQLQIEKDLKRISPRRQWFKFWKKPTVDNDYLKAIQRLSDEYTQLIDVFDSVQHLPNLKLEL